MEISLSGFIRFTNASPRAKARLARQIAEQARGEYDPATDFWRPIRQAVARDRKTSRDGEPVRAVALSAASRRQNSYKQVSEQWIDLTPRWRSSALSPVATSRVDVGTLTVRLRPLFAENWSDGQREAAHLWFNKEELQPDTVAAVQQVIAKIGGSSRDQVFVDLRRGAISPASAQTSPEAWAHVSDLGNEFVHLAGGEHHG